VSRAHVLRLLRDAEDAGFLVRVGAGKDSIELQAKLTQAALDMFATMFLYQADSARTAMMEMAGEGACAAGALDRSRLPPLMRVTVA